MASAPDILVTATGSHRILLAVEAKFTLQELGDAEPALKRYMVKMGVPVGLLITPKLMVIYKNRYTGTSENSVERVREFNVSEFGPGLSRFLRQLSEEHAAQKSSDMSSAFEENVQSWLEDLHVSGITQEVTPELRDAFSDYILPALNEGVIRAAHPREYSA